MRSFYVWPCGTWCNKEDLHQYGWMSDDYRLISVPDDTTDAMIEVLVAFIA